jgi:chromosome partitioning protein
VILASLILATVYFAYRSLTMGLKLKQMRSERDTARRQVREGDLLAHELRTKLGDSEALAKQRRQEVHRLTEEHGRLSQVLATAKDSLRGTQQHLERCCQEREALQTRFHDLQKIDADVWKGPAPTGTAPPPFVPREERKTRFVAFLNLKGGVGKTTLVANLAGAYTTEITATPLRVLAVDLDYQGTLSNMCVARNEVLDYRSKANNRTSHLLLVDTAEVPASVLPPLLATLDGSRGYGRVVVADEGLDHIDFRQQARFAVEHREVRFHHRRLLHDPFVFNQFDLVFFDCPPRLTTSTVNALAASDYIVIPTSLHPNDVDAVPRTLRWLDKLQEMPTFQAKLAGVILNRTYRKATLERGLTKDEPPGRAPTASVVYFWGRLLLGFGFPAPLSSPASSFWKSSRPRSGSRSVSFLMWAASR